MDKTNNNLLRLNKYLAQWGGISRREADRVIQKGEVFINGKKVSQSAVFVDPKKDAIRWKKRKIHSGKKEFIYLMFNKPPKVLTTTKDPKGRATVMDYIKKHKERLFPVGRLDWDSEGLLLLSNDGDFSSKVLHPKSKIPKTYLVKLRAFPKDSQIKKLVRGVSTPFGRRKALFAKKLSKKSSSSSWVKVIIDEGKKRQIRLMFDTIGYPVQKLRRTAIGRLKMNKLPKAGLLKLTEKDIKKIFQKPKELGSYTQRRKLSTKKKTKKRRSRGASVKKRNRR